MAGMLEALLNNGKRLTEHLALAGLGLFAFGALQYPALANVGLALTALAALVGWRESARRFTHEPLVGLLVLFAVMVGAGLLLAWPSGHRAEDLDGAERLLKLWLFLPLAYWLNGREKRILAYLALAMLGFCVARVAKMEWLATPALVTGERIRLGISSINHFALYSATVLIGLACFTPRVLRALALLRPRVRDLGLAAWAALILLSLYWTMAAQSRGIWLSTVATALVLTTLLGLSHGRRAMLVGLAGATLTGAILALAVGNLLTERFGAEMATVGAALTGKWAALPYDSTGTRLHMISFGLERWREAPWLGHGPGGLTTILQESGGELSIYKHLHNVFIDNLARLGMLGTILLQGLFVAVFYAAWRAYRTGRIPTDISLFVIGGLSLAFFANLTDLRLFGWDWRNFWLLLASVAYTVPLRVRG